MRFFDLLARIWTLFSELRAILVAGIIKKEMALQSLNKVRILANKSKNLTT